MRLQRHALAATIGALLACPVVSAQDTAEADRAAQLQRVEVTGSRIRKPAIEGQTPVNVITRERILRSGLSSIGDLLQQLTGSGSALNTRFNSSGNFGFPPDGSGVGAGSSTVDLRHLGSKRVLVLVDGVRWVNEASASGVSSATDLNTLPLAIVERIEVLEDGASAIYGSDAIAGVINIITRRNFEGATASLNYGEFERGGRSHGGDLAFGGSGEDYSFFLGASLSDQSALASTAWDPAAVPVPGTGLAFGSSATPNGRFVFIDPTSGALRDLTTPNGQSFPDGPQYPQDFIPFGTANRFNYAEYNLLLTPSERQGLFGQARFDIGESTTWFVRALLNRRESLNQAAPEPIFLGPEAGTGNPWADDVLISASNPYNPFGFDLASSGPGANLLLVGRRPVEGGPRRFEQTVDTWYLATGMEGSFDIGAHGWFWDFNLASSRNRAEQTNTGSYNIRRIHLALGPVSACNASPGCVPLDLFGGPGSITPAMLAYIQPVIHDRSDNRLQLASLNLSGDVFDLQAGPISFATGVEHRRLEGEYRPDAITVAGEYNGVPSLPTAGDYHVNELFAEFNIPLYEGGSSRLDLSLAGRYSDYSTFGGESTGKFGLRWQLSDDLLLRGTWAQGFRAPSIGELFGSAARFDAVIDDPCLIGLDGSPAEADCSAFGVPAGARQANGQIAVTTGGNVELEPERADSYTLGWVWSPAFADGSAWSDQLDIEFSYYHHRIDGAVQAIDAQTQLDLCVAEGPGSPFCAGIGRAGTGGINRFDNRLQNFGSIETGGYDLDLFWTLPESELGQFKLAWQNTRVASYRAVDGLGSAQPAGVGIEVNDSGIPEWNSLLSLGWSLRDFSASYTLRFTSALEEDCGDAASFPVCSGRTVIGTDEQGQPIYAGRNHLGSTAYSDLQLGWRAPWLGGMQLTLGVNNLFGRDPPLCLSCSLNGYDASSYDLPAGRFVYTRAELRF